LAAQHEAIATLYIPACIWMGVGGFHPFGDQGADGQVAGQIT